MNTRRPPAPVALAITLLGLLALLVGCATGGAAASGPAPQAAVDPGVLAAVQALNEVCARRDLAGFMALFEEGDDVALVGSDVGEVFRGRAAVGGFMERLFGLPFTFSFLLPDPQVRQRGDVAWVFVDGAMVHTMADGRSRQVPYRITGVLVRRPGGWRWQLFSGSAPRAE